MNSDEILLDEVEASWIPNVEIDQLPETSLAIRAHNLLADKIQLADVIANRCVELGMTGEVTRENYDKAKLIKGMCVKARGDVKRNAEAANRKAIDWQKAINKRKGELIEAIESIEKPYAAGIKAIDDEKARIKAEKEAAEQQRILDEAKKRLEEEQAAERKRIADEREKNRVEAERIAAERKRLDDDKAAADATARAARAVNEELAELKRQMKEDEDKRKANDAPQGQPAKLVPMDSHGYPIPDPGWTDDTPSGRFMAATAPRKSDDEIEAECKEWEAEHAEMRQEIQSADQQKVNDFGNAIMALQSSRPLVVKREARQAIELAVLDLRDIGKRLQEWRMP